MPVDGLRLAESPWGMNSLHGFILPLFLCTQMALAVGDDDYKPGPDSLPQPGVPKGEMVKDKYTAKENSVFPGTEREYQIYLPAGLDASKPAPFMVFQDGVIYQAPVVFDNLIAKKEIPPVIGIFIKPGVVPASNENALPRFNRSYEYDSVTNTYSYFLIEEFLPAIKEKHKLNLSDDPNARGIAGSSSGGICAFMVAWHRPDQFRRVFTSVGTYVGIHGADQLAVLVRKHEPKPLRIHLQSGEGDNDLYCGDWWMANQMMERSLTWNGYDVSHTWGTGGHNQKHATAIFPDVLRGLWKGYPEEPVKANPRGDSKWRGYEVVGDGEWEKVEIPQEENPTSPGDGFQRLAAANNGTIYAAIERPIRVLILPPSGLGKINPNLLPRSFRVFDIAIEANGQLTALREGSEGHRSLVTIRPSDKISDPIRLGGTNTFVLRHDGVAIAARDDINFSSRSPFDGSDKGAIAYLIQDGKPIPSTAVFSDVPDLNDLSLSPDQTLVYASTKSAPYIYSTQLVSKDRPRIDGDPFAANVELIKGPAFNAVQRFGILEQIPGVKLSAGGLCVDTNGWLYVATSLGIQVLDQAGRVNFIIPTPKQPHDVCFGGKDLSELFIACGDAIYKRPTKAKGYISGQMAPIKPPPPKL